jgi:hypothetical protein
MELEAYFVPPNDGNAMIDVIANIAEFGVVCFLAVRSSTVYLIELLPD